MSRRYVDRLAELIRSGVIKTDPGTVTEIEVRHDPTCPALRGGGRCGCQPEFWLGGQRIDQEGAKP